MASLDLETVRAYLKVPATALTDADLQRMLDSCADDQAQRCRWPGSDTTPPADPPATLDQALLRRVQREVAARNLPLGMVGIDAEYGPARIPALDVLIEEHERPFRIQVVG